MSEDGPKEPTPSLIERAQPPSAHVISLESRKRSGATAMLTVPHRAPCVAHHYVISRKTRLAECSKCGETFECFDAMVDLAEHWGDYQGNRNAIKKEIESLAKEREALKLEVERLKAFERRKYRAIAETSPHATRCLELLLRIYRSKERYQDKWELHKLMRQVQHEAKVVPMRKGEPDVEMKEAP